MAEKKAASKPAAAKAVSKKATTSAKPAVTQKQAAPKITVQELEREIRAEAQKVYEARRAKGGAGDELADWLQAEKVVKQKYKLA